MTGHDRIGEPYSSNFCFVVLATSGIVTEKDDTTSQEPTSVLPDLGSNVC